MDDHLPLQIPNFVYQQTPTLVPGGGAEVVPLANSQWFVLNGFTPAAIDNSYFSGNPHQSVQHQSTSAPFEFTEQAHHHEHQQQQQHQRQHQRPPQPPPDFSVFLAPSPLGLPVYSQSGFDMVSLLARVAHRPNPRIHLGPVDLTAAFCVVDTRRYDHPIVYCSPTFCTLTGYTEAEVLNRNCRFLQAPGGDVPKGSVRKHTPPTAVNNMRKALLADKECQESIINYKKDGSVFVNLVTVIPVPPLDDGEVIYQIGFQVDLNEQPGAILENLRKGTYAVESDRAGLPPPPLPSTQGQVQVFPGGRRISLQTAKDRKSHAIPPIVMSKTLRRLLGDPAFMRSLPITYPALGAPSLTTGSTTTLTTITDESTNASTSASTVHPAHANHPLHLLLLEAAPDFVHVVSLKGDFLYVAPSVRRVLGFEATEMQGKGLADYAHPEDVVPLMRELKEASSALGAGMGAGGTGEGSGVSSASAQMQANGGSGSANNNGNANGSTTSSTQHPRPVDLLFRCRTAFGRYVWVEARGRLYVEPGKGRKAIILTGRAREMVCLQWADVGRAGGLALGVRESVTQGHLGSNATVAEGVTAGSGDVSVGVGGGAKAGVAVTGSGSAGAGAGTSLGSGTSDTGSRQAEAAFCTRAQEAWGLLGGTCAHTAVFAAIGSGMRDVLGWAAEDLLGRGMLRTVVVEEGIAVESEAYTREGERGREREMEDRLVVRSIGEAVRSLRRAQKWLRQQRRPRAVEEHQNQDQHELVYRRQHQNQQQQAAAAAAGVDLARVRKIACRLRTKAGDALACWVVVYRADVDDSDEGAEDVNGMKHEAMADEGGDGANNIVDSQHQGQMEEAQAQRKPPLRADAGASITPAPLVFQIRVMNAETVRVPVLVHGATSAPSSASATASATVSLQALGIPYGMPVWKTSPPSSTLAAASPSSSPGPSLSSSPPPAAAVAISPTAHAALTTGAGDVFAELAVARGSSWQYELQQLRITNMRLREELAELEAAEAALGSGGGGGGSTSGKVMGGQQQQVAMVVQPQPPRAQSVQGVQAPMYTRTQAQGSSSYEPAVVYQQQQQNVYQYEPLQSMELDMDVDYPYSEHMQQSFFAQSPSHPPQARRHTVSTAPLHPPHIQHSGSNTNSGYVHHSQSQSHQPLDAPATTLGGDGEAAFHAGVRAALAKRQGPAHSYQQVPPASVSSQPQGDSRSLHNPPVSRAHPRAPLTSSLPPPSPHTNQYHPASEQIQQHFLPSDGLAAPISGHTYGQPLAQQEHQYQLQHQPHPHAMHHAQPHTQQQRQTPVPVSMQMSLSATRWPSTMSGYINNNNGDVNDTSRKRTWSAVNRPD